MRAALFRIRVLAAIESLLRIRRGSTGVLFLLLTAAAYLLMPDVQLGRTVFKIGPQRVFLDSAATSFSTGMVGSLLLSLVGFYLISNSLARDERTGMGRLIASTSVNSSGYLAGKFLGNCIYLGVIALG